MNTKETRNEIFCLEARMIENEKKVAFIAGGINREINNANVKAKMKSLSNCGQIMPLVVVDGADVIAAGLSLKDPISGLLIESDKAEEYLVIIEGQHRYRAIVNLREQDEKDKKKRDEDIKKWQKDGSKPENKPEEYTLKAPSKTKAMYPLNETEKIQIMISEMNNTSVKWAKGDYVRQAFAMYPDNEVLKFITRYMDMQHQKAKKGEADDMLPNGGFSLTTLSKYLIYSADIKESVIADTCKYGEEVLENKMDNKSGELVKRAETIIQAGLDAGFNYRFLAKGFFIDWIAKKSSLETDYKKIIKMLKNVSREVIDSIMQEAKKHNFEEQLNRIG